MSTMGLACVDANVLTVRRSLGKNTHIPLEIGEDLLTQWKLGALIHERVDNHWTSQTSSRTTL
ncbi:hypothetical protein M413DRAFT_449643 [Hebeloma cylindrosporum]|uniref:Uncharacterized protein n=1 Tax=Hebeloma cylindrosporum TaxID=76867 RepID=A0A0C3BFW7_HEBCY|nr:hypothetical protein M413DRAFT_449643 [Hebeloma cylindrosporum h7]